MSSPTAMSPLDHRALYTRALDPEGPLPLGDARGALRAALAGPAPPGPSPSRVPGTPDDLIERARSWAEEQTRRFHEVLDPIEGEDRPPAVRRVLLNCAPLCLSAGAWLQWLSSADNAESEWALRVLSLYACDVGVGLPDADRGASYRALLGRHRLADITPGMRLAGSEQLESAGFRLPGMLLAMSRLPEHFLPELLGADLCLRAAGLPPPLGGLVGREVDGDAARELDLGAARAGWAESGVDLSGAAVRALLAQPPPVAGDRPGERVRQGFDWALAELSYWSDDLLAQLALGRHPDYDIWRLIRTRARPASVYHAAYQLEGRPLADWFQDLEAGPGPFLDALARSPLVRPGRPERSPLVNGLVGERGPMFRVFTEDELEVLRRWIARLPERERARAADSPEDGDRALHEARHGWNLPVAPGHPAGETARTGTGSRTGPRTPPGTPPGTPRGTSPATSLSTDEAPDPTAFDPRSLREAYRVLLSRRDSPRLRRFALAYTERWLARSRYRLDRVAGLPPTLWNRDSGLRDWLGSAHDGHARRLDEAAPDLPSREELIESTLQLAPLIMIDGGWLRGFTDYRHASSPYGHFLFRTYWDELGNGDRELNHPRIYRALLAEMGVDLPPTDSAEFAAWPGFDDESFATPVYWLCVSRFPQTFLPEILGLNLAMELSGVGGGYRSAAVALRHYGYSSQFVDLHNTIDNVATGHSAWAVDAIDSYLTDLPRLLGPHQQEAAWARLRVGYRSLNPPGGPAARLYAALRSGGGRGRAARVPGTARENR
ncbi:iron-containing redox enzyme family protein [Streptomyces sp. NPDC057307]|uniref:iron-containing redox enzyme family protein n=1 Tax=Streptomyces sp. NPDC057307 TaxID=3346096 RepID=UPI00363109C6